MYATMYANSSSIPFINISEGSTPNPPSAHHLTESEMDALSVVSVLTAGLSLVGSSSVLLCSIYHNRVCFPEIFPTFQLAVADLLSSLFLLMNSSLFLSDHNAFPGNPGACGYIMTIVTSFYTTTFLLIMTYALEALLRFRKRLREGYTLDSLNTHIVSSRWMYLAYILAWLLPLSLAAMLMVVTHYLKDWNNYSGMVRIIPMQCSSCFADFRFNENYCWEQVENGERWHKMIRLIFLIPLIIVMVCNMILYFLIGRVFKQVAMRRGLLSYHQRQEESLLKRKSCMYQGLFFVCWTPSVILGILSFIEDYSMSKYYWLLLIQALLGPLQGILNSFLYGWRRDSFRRALTERSSLLSTNRSSGVMSVTL